MGPRRNRPAHSACSPRIPMMESRWAHFKRAALWSSFPFFPHLLISLFTLQRSFSPPLFLSKSRGWKSLKPEAVQLCAHRVWFCDSQSHSRMTSGWVALPGFQALAGGYLRANSPREETLNPRGFQDPFHFIVKVTSRIPRGPLSLSLEKCISFNRLDTSNPERYQTGQIKQALSSSNCGFNPRSRFLPAFPSLTSNNDWQLCSVFNAHEPFLHDLRRTFLQLWAGNSACVVLSPGKQRWREVKWPVDSGLWTGPRCQSTTLPRLPPLSSIPKTRCPFLEPT